MNQIIGDQDNSDTHSTHRSIKKDNALYHMKKVVVVCERLSLPHNVIDADLKKKVVKCEKISADNADMKYVKGDLLVQADLKLAASGLSLKMKEPALKYVSTKKDTFVSVKIKDNNADAKNTVGENFKNVGVTSTDILPGVTSQDFYPKTCERPLVGIKFEAKTSQHPSAWGTVSVLNIHSEDRKVNNCSKVSKREQKSIDANFGSQDDEPSESDHMASFETYTEEEISSDIGRAVSPYAPRTGMLNDHTAGEEEPMANPGISESDKFSASFKCGREYSRNHSLNDHKKAEHFHDNVFSCELCSKSYFSKYKYENHLKMHSIERPFHCNDCGLGWIHKSALNQHIKRVHLKHAKLFCNHCSRSFSYRQTLISHLQMHDGVRPFVCKDCGKDFRKKDNLEKHFVVHTKEKRFRCGTCGNSFTEKGSLKKHVTLHIGGMLFICNECGRGFSQKNSLRCHIKRLHVKGRTFSCPHCSKSLASKASLKSHVKRIHERKEIYNCGECDKRFFSKDFLRVHIYRHTKSKEYICNDCGRVFHNREHFILHTRIHTGFRPYKCKYCSKSFTQATALNNHVILHTGEKRFSCKFCERKFGRKDHLYNHERTHTK